MMLPKFLTTVTPFSKYLALSLLVTLPVLSFHYGRYYESKIYKNEVKETKAPLVTKKTFVTPANSQSPVITLTQQQFESYFATPKLAVPKLDLSVNWKQETLNIENPTGLTVTLYTEPSKELPRKGTQYTAEVTVNNEEYEYSSFFRRMQRDLSNRGWVHEDEYKGIQIRSNEASGPQGATTIYIIRNNNLLKYYEIAEHTRIDDRISPTGSPPWLKSPHRVKYEVFESDIFDLDQYIK